MFLKPCLQKTVTVCFTDFSLSFETKRAHVGQCKIRDISMCFSEIKKKYHHLPHDPSRLRPVWAILLILFLTNKEA